MHDVGKIGIPETVLQKEGPLSDEEWKIMKQHPTIGAEKVLAPNPALRDLIPIVKYHHERIDGKGYPHGLKGDEIPLLARIISVADAFDAMTSDRVYRTKMDLSVAIEQLERGKNAQFDAKVVDVFVELLKDYPKMKEELASTYAPQIEMV